MYGCHFKWTYSIFNVSVAQRFNSWTSQRFQHVYTWTFQHFRNCNRSPLNMSTMLNCWPWPAIYWWKDDADGCADAYSNECCPSSICQDSNFSTSHHSRLPSHQNVNISTLQHSINFKCPTSQNVEISNNMLKLWTEMFDLLDRMQLVLHYATGHFSMISTLQRSNIFVISNISSISGLQHFNVEETKYALQSNINPPSTTPLWPWKPAQMQHKYYAAADQGSTQIVHDIHCAVEWECKSAALDDLPVPFWMPWSNICTPCVQMCSSRGGRKARR